MKQTEYTAEFTCMWCGRNVGDSIVSDQPISTVPPRKCATCGGPAAIELTSREVRAWEAVDMADPDNKPRRGRRPRWLIEELRQKEVTRNATEAEPQGTASA